MRPITRETIGFDRRQGTLKWSAVFGGAAVAVALWLLLQMLGMGVGLAAIDLNDAGSLRSVGIGTTVWTLVAPLIALFVGGCVAGRLATTYSDRIGALHGFVTWAVASVLGLLATVAVVGLLASGSMRGATAGLSVSDDVTVYPRTRHMELQRATDTAGKVLLGASLSLLVGLGAAVGGGAIATHKPGRRRRSRDAATHTTLQTPVVPPPEQQPETD